MRSLLPRGLRARLILSFGVLVFLSLFLAGATTAVLLKEQQEQNAKDRLGLLARPVSLQASVLELGGVHPGEIEALLQRQYGVRIILFDANATVVADTGATLTGKRVDRLLAAARPNLRYRLEHLREEDERLVLFWAPKSVMTGPNGEVLFEPKFQAAIAVPASEVGHAWRDLLPRLFLAGGISFLVAVIAASLLARSITRPLRQITAASEAMARGRYDQQIAAPGGGEEVGRLANAFNEMARQVSRSHRTLRDFLANVSHELKTPLTSIQGFSQAILDGTVSEKEGLQEAGRIINDEAQRMRGLVDDLLYLSQVEAGEAAIHFDRVSPGDLLRATSERFQRRAQQAHVDLVIETGPTPVIKADARRLEQALANIVDNAVRHTPAGGRVTLRSAAADGHVRLAVHNSGSVIPPEALPRIFDRFFQADPVGARADANTGLGLAITKEIVEAHGGTVTATSTPEAGTEFVILLPLPEEGR